MKKYFAHIKEVYNDTILKPKYQGAYKSKNDIIKYWGLDNMCDIEWYEIFEVLDDGTAIKIAKGYGKK